MKKNFIMIILLFITLTGMIFFSACQAERDYIRVPLTEEEVTEWTKEHFFDKDGKAYKSYWEDSWINHDPKKMWKYNGEDIDGFSVQKIKGFDGRDNYFLVEFEPTGYFFVDAEERPNAISFCAYPSPFKMYNVPTENRYAARFGSAAPMCGVECRPGYIAQFDGLEKVYDVGYEQFPTTMRVYNKEKHEWTSMYVGVFDPETATWKEETEQLYYRDHSKEPLTLAEVERWTRERFFDKDGKAYKYHWEDAVANIHGNGLWDIYGDVTGFDAQEVHGFDGNKYYLVNFKPTGYFIVRADYPMNAYTFSPYKDPFSVYDIPEERRYVYIEEKAYFGVDREDGFIVTIQEPTPDGSGRYGEMQTQYVYDTVNKRFDTSIKPGKN